MMPPPQGKACPTLAMAPSDGAFTHGGRDAHGLRPRPRPGVAQAAAALQRVGSRARAVIRRWSRPLPIETLFWIVLVALALLFAITLFTRERAIAP